MREIPKNIFEAQQMLSELAGSQARNLTTSFKPFEIKTSAASAGGLLTVPELQSNTARLEAIVHLIISNASGRRKPNKQDAARWFKQLGKVCARMEDAAEDVFVTRVYMDGQNYRVLEGLAEANGYHLQHILTAIETMPNQGIYLIMKISCRALLTISDLICSKSKLEAFICGDEYGHDTLPVDELATLKTLAARVTFSDDDLAHAGIDRAALSPFCLPQSQRNLDLGGYGDSQLEKRPIINFPDKIVVALPSAIGTAIRSFVIQTCQDNGLESGLWNSLLISYIEDISLNPALSRIRFPSAKIAFGASVIASEPVEFQPGLWLQLILLTDKFTGFKETGFSQPMPSDEKMDAELQRTINDTAALTQDRPGFKLGLSIVILCGIGRSQLVQFNSPSRWISEGISSYDLDVLGWKNNFSVVELIKFLLSERVAEHMGFPMMAINGLLARIGFAYANNGHVVPHEIIPDGTEYTSLVVPTNAHLQLRANHHARFDKHTVRDPAGDVLVVRRKDGGKRSPQNTQRIYVSHSDAQALRYRALWKSGGRIWWLETIPLTTKAEVYPIFEMQMVWMERLAPILIHHVPGLPDVLTWRLIAPEHPLVRPKEMEEPSRKQIKTDIKVNLDLDKCVITTEIGLMFFHGLSHPTNVSENVLIECFVENAILIADNAAVDVSALLQKIIPSSEARQLHAFVPQDFRDYVRDKVSNKVVEISEFDDASLRLGLGWHGFPRPGGTIRGRDECTKALNAITTAAEDRLCEYLRQFNRKDLVCRLVENHEASIIDKSQWERTAGAILDLSANPKETREEIYERVRKSNATSYACRVILEAALCESPVEDGFEPADFDLSILLALAMLIHHLGGYSDAIHYEGMSPQIRISPAGEVQIDGSFFDNIVTPVGRSFISDQINKSRREYSDLLHDPEKIGEEQAAIQPDPNFAAAWEAEMGISLKNFRIAIEVIENHLVDVEKAWIVLPRPKLLQLIGERIDCAEDFVASLELLPRNGWKNVQPPYNDQDRQPWRFRRRLSASRRPILRIEPNAVSDVLIAPGMIRDAFRILLYNFYYGQYDISSLASKKMKIWREHIVAEESANFEERVVVRLRELGWKARRGAKFSHILGRSLLEDPGDIDVLAWHPDGRIMLLECKDLQFAKTSSEIAKQLHKFRGRSDSRGRPDLLAKHLKRIEIAQDSSACSSFVLE